MKVNTDVRILCELESCRDGQRFVITKHIPKLIFDSSPFSPKEVVKKAQEKMQEELRTEFFSDKNKSISQE